MAAYEGQVSGSAQRWETDHGEQVLVWDFRLERADEKGAPLPRIPVEMRGQGFDGSLSDGDWVQVDGKWQQGETLHVDAARNLTTGAEVRSKRHGHKLRTAVRLIGFLIFLAFLAFVIQQIAQGV